MLISTATIITAIALQRREYRHVCYHSLSCDNMQKMSNESSDKHALHFWLWLNGDPMFIMCLLFGNDVISLESRPLIFVYLYVRTHLISKNIRSSKIKACRLLIASSLLMWSLIKLDVKLLRVSFNTTLNISWILYFLLYMVSWLS